MTAVEIGQQFATGLTRETHHVITRSLHCVPLLRQRLHNDGRQTNIATEMTLENCAQLHLILVVAAQVGFEHVATHVRDLVRCDTINR